MLDFLIANWGTLLVGVLILAAVLGVIIKMVRDKQQGESSCSCGCGGCSGCGGNSVCHGHTHQLGK